MKENEPSPIKIYMLAEELSQTATYLLLRADSCDHIGLIKLADYFLDTSRRLEQISATIKQEVHKWQDENIKAAEQNSATILATALASAELGKEEEK